MATNFTQTKLSFDVHASSPPPISDSEEWPGRQFTRHQTTLTNFFEPNTLTPDAAEPAAPAPPSPSRFPSSKQAS